MTKGQGWIIIAELGILLWALYQAAVKAQAAATQLENSPIGEVTTGLSTLFSNL